MNKHSNYDRPIFVETQFPIAFDSPDHITPWGTMRDNSSNMAYIEEMEAHFGRSISVLDIGCSGGRLIRDFHERGHVAVGIEGSDYSVKNNRAEWPDLHNKHLFTCDAGRDYQIRFSDNQDPVMFDLISAWEVIEHIHPEMIGMFFQNIVRHLNTGGFFVGSISTVGDGSTGLELHQSLHSEQEWKENILNKYFTIGDYPFKNLVRREIGSFYVILKKLGE